MDLEQEIFQDQPDVPDEFLQLSAEDIKTRTRSLDNEIRVLKDESTRLSLEQRGLKQRIKENAEKVHHHAFFKFFGTVQPGTDGCLNTPICADQAEQHAAVPGQQHRGGPGCESLNAPISCGTMGRCLRAVRTGWCFEGSARALNSLCTECG